MENHGAGRKWWGWEGRCGDGDQPGEERWTTICPTWGMVDLCGATIAIAVGEEAETLEEVHEPFLIQEGYLQRTAQGRILTSKGYHAIGLPGAGPAPTGTLL